MNNTTNNFDNIMNEDAIREKYLKGNKAKLQTAKIATAFMIIAALFISWFVLDAPKGTAKGWVYDKDGVLSDATVNAVNNKNDYLFDRTGAEVVVVVEKDSGKNTDLVKRAEKLFKDYKVSDSGVLFIMSVYPSDTTSGGVVGEWVNSLVGAVEGIFGTGGNYTYAYRIGRNVPYSLDDRIDDIFEDNFYEAYDAGNYNAAVLDTFNAFAGYFEQEYNLTPGNTAYAGSVNNQSDSNGGFAIRTTIQIINIGIIFFVLAGAIIIVGAFNRRSYGRPRRVYRKSSWFGPGLGFGLGWGLGRSVYRNNNRPYSKKNNAWGPGSFKSNSSNPRSGGGGGSPRSGGGGFKGGGSSRGGGGRRR